MTIADIMEATHKRPRDGGEMLLKKVALGDANATEKQVLLDRYKALAKLKPAKGDAADWEARTKRLVDAAEAAVKGKPGSDKQLQRAANCMACHNEHKAS